MNECRRCGNETNRHSVAAHPLCWDCADHGPVDELRSGPNGKPSAIERRREADEH